jgi:hypothetical protein
MRRSIPHLAAILLLSGAIPALAGVRLVSVDKHDGGKTRSQVSLDEQALRVDLQGEGAGHTVIFRKDKQLAWMIDRNDRTYMEITKQDMEEMAAQIAEARKMMEQQLASLPPSQREMMEKMMKQQMPMGLGAVAEPDYTKVESGVTVHGWTCDRYEGTRDGKKVVDVWTVEPAELGVRRDDFAVLAELGEFFQGLAKNLGASFPNFKMDADEGAGFDGIPVRYVSYDGGSVRSEHEVEEVSQQTFDAALFELPDGLEKKDMPAAKRR